MTVRAKFPIASVSQITTATTTAVKATGGILQRVVVLNVVASTITFNDGLGAKFVLPASVPVGTYDLGIQFAGKIECVTAGASNLLVLFD